MSRSHQLEGWHGLLNTETKQVDVLPDDDLIVHEYGEDCVCKPETEASSDGEYTAVFHSALDGRPSPLHHQHAYWVVDLRWLAAGVAALAGVVTAVRRRRRG